MIDAPHGLRVVYFNHGDWRKDTPITYPGRCRFEWQGDTLVIVGPELPLSVGFGTGSEVYSFPRENVGTVTILGPPEIPEKPPVMGAAGSIRLSDKP